jgi:DNA polymerase
VSAEPKGVAIMIPASLQPLYDEIASKFTGMPKFGTTFVPGFGNPEARLVFIGEAPGEEEEKRRRPFVGPAGRNLDRLLELAGLWRDEIFLTNVVKYRPVDPRNSLKNRKPTKREMELFLPYLKRELEILSPELIVCLGSTSAEALLANRVPMSSCNGVLIHGDPWPIFVVYHPSPLNFNQPERRFEMEEAFKYLGTLLSSPGTKAVAGI